jgi:flap endonuclease-1
MGIQGLTRVIADNAPAAIRENGIGTYFGRKVAIDASMSIYQFLVAVRSEGSVLTNEAGETTSHIMGMFYRTIRMVENGIKPLYVFDGAPPKRKSGELAKRLDRRTEAEASAELAKDAGSTAMMDKFNRRTVKATKQHTEDCKKLLGLMGIPVVQAPCEAEAQCAALVKMGLAFAAGSEDMDTLTFGTPILLRHLTFSEARKMPIVDIHLQQVLDGLGFSMDQFIDLCILLGCDYCDSIKGIGPTRAVQLVKEHQTLEAIIESLDRNKYVVSEEWPYQEARELFRNPLILAADDPQLTSIKWELPNEEALLNFMVQENGFNEKRIRAGIEKLVKAKGASTQGRLDSFFKVLPASDGKRKELETKKPTAAKGPKKSKTGRK